MKVCYGGNFWGNPGKGEELKKVDINREFVWEEVSGFIPAIYIGEQGMAVDFCIRVPNDEVRVFYDKWKLRLKAGLREEEEEKISEENPLNINFGLKAWVNGEKAENDYSCSASYSSVIMQEADNTGVETQLMQEYGCEADEGWSFKRYMFRWEREPERLHILELELTGENRDYPGEAVEIGTGDNGNRYTVMNPADRKTYELFVKDVKQEEIEREILECRRRKNCHMEYPNHYLQLIYSMDPELPQGKFRLQDVCAGDSPRSGKDICTNNGVSVVIGHVDGPTAVFVAGKKKEQGDSLAVSALYFEPVEKISWRPVFMEKERKDMRLYIEI